MRAAHLGDAWLSWGGHMAKQTNADRVLGLLTEAGGAWVRGAELLHPAVGGSRFGARILELRKRGYNIERRSDPKSALHQYRLVSDKRVDSSTVRQSVGEYECMGCGYRIVFGGKELLGGFIENYCGNENKRAVFKLA